MLRVISFAFSAEKLNIIGKEIRLLIFHKAFSSFVREYRDQTPKHGCHVEWLMNIIRIGKPVATALHPSLPSNSQPVLNVELNTRKTGIVFIETVT